VLGYQHPRSLLEVPGQGIGSEELVFVGFTGEADPGRQPRRHFVLAGQSVVSDSFALGTMGQLSGVKVGEKFGDGENKVSAILDFDRR
jgi:hypothetical protein